MSCRRRYKSCTQKRSTVKRVCSGVCLPFADSWLRDGSCTLTLMKWSFRSAFDTFEAASAEWDSLNRSQHDHILLDSGFVAPLLHYFGPRNVQLGTSCNSAAPGMVLVIRKSLGLWETFQPSQAPLGLFVAASREEPAKYFPEMLSGLPNSAMQLSVLQQDPDFCPLSPQLASRRVEPFPFLDTARLTLQGTFEEYWASRNDDLRRNLMRRMRRLEKQGSRLEMATLTDPGQVADAIRQYGRIEAQGWKGRAGTAITEDNDQAHFYRDVMQHFCARGEGFIYQVRLDGRLIASEMFIGRKGMLVGLKTTFDESLREISPGFLMKYLIIRQLFSEREFRTIEFYGRLKDWHSKWATDIRPMFHFNYFRYAWIRSLKQTVKKLAFRGPATKPESQRELAAPGAQADGRPASDLQVDQV